MPAPTNPHTPAAAPPNSASSPSKLPSPATFDFLFQLHVLLTRLLLPPANPNNQNSIVPPSTSPRPSAHSEQSTQPHSTQSDQTPLSPKDLATAASVITAKIQKATVAVKGIEGGEMGLEEQEEWIAELEKEVERGRGTLEGLRMLSANVLSENMDIGNGESAEKV